MPIISAIKNREFKKTGKFHIEPDLLKEIEAYCNWASINDFGTFFNRAAKFILKKDLAWKKQQFPLA